MRIFIRRILNLLLYLGFCALIGTGLLMAFRLVPGSRGGQGLELLGWNRHQWGDLHTWISYGLIALIALHLVINRAWLIKVAAGGHLWRLLVGLTAGLAIIAVFLLLPISRKEGSGGGRGRGGGGRGRGFSSTQSERGEHIQARTPALAEMDER